MDELPNLDTAEPDFAAPMTFECSGGCSRILPDYMNTGGDLCSSCAPGTSTEEVLDELRGGTTSEESEKTASGGGSGTIPISGPEGQKTRKGSNDTDRNSDNHQSIAVSSTQPGIEFHIQIATGEEEYPSVDVFSLGRYDSSDYEGDTHSNNIIQCVKRGNYQGLNYFSDQLKSFFDSRVDEMARPEAITVYPGHDGEINAGLKRLTKQVCEDWGIRYRQYLERRRETAKQSQQEYDERLENQRGTIAVSGDVEEKTVYIFDDIVTSGSSMVVGAKALKEAGAKKVIGLSLGHSKAGQSGRKVKQLSSDSHTVTSVLRGQ